MAIAPNTTDVDLFVAGIDSDLRRNDSRELLALLRDATGKPGVMWGASIVGFGDLHYRYASGREGDTFIVGFSPRKAAITIYGLLDPSTEVLLTRLGPHTLGAGCVYIKTLSGIDRAVLRGLVDSAFARAAR